MDYSLGELYDDLPLAPGIDRLYPHQEEAVDWAVERPEPYLFINAPTGSGKTLLLTTVGQAAGVNWTYAVHTIMLQNQVARTFENIPVLMGRRNFECMVWKDTHPFAKLPVTADQAICAMDEYHRGDCAHDGSEPFDPCDYYDQRYTAMESHARVVNYAMLLNYPPLVMPSRSPHDRPTQLLLADEAHNVEQAVCDSVSLAIFARTLKRLHIDLPQYDDILDWAGWAERKVDDVPQHGKDVGFRNLRRTLDQLRLITAETAGEWIISKSSEMVSFEPVWGAPFVMEKLMGHKEVPEGTALMESMRGKSRGIRKAVFTSATLMGAEYIAESLGLPDGSWAYLDMASTFPVANRPINYSPVDGMNATKLATPEGRATMQEAVDDLIEFYVRGGKPWGVIHAVSNRYRDFILTESRWRGIMVSTPDEHEAKVSAGEASVLVAANLTEGWDGRDDLCRFVIMPKVPFPNLGDKRTKIRMQEDARSFDHKALVAIVQGAGRGVRHREDYCDTWILDKAWQMLFSKRRDWLPQSFVDAYHHKVALPQI